MRRSVFVLLVLAGAALAAPAGASAAGSSTIALSGSGLKALRDAGIGLKATKPARASTKAVYLPVSGGSVAKSRAILRHGGSLTLAVKKTSLVLRGFELRLEPKPVLRARVGGKTMTVFTVKYARKRSPALDTGKSSVALKGATLSLSSDAGKAIKRAFKLSKAPSGAFGTLTVAAAVGSGGGTTNPGGGGGGGTNPGGGGGGGTNPGGGGGGGTNPGGGGGGSTVPCTARPDVTPRATPAITPPPPPKPAGALTITSATITWHVRESFIQYINSGEGTSVSGGATAADPSVACGSDAKLVYSFGFPFSGSTPSWYDPATGKAAIYGGGGVRFRYTAHTIDFTTSAPEVELDLNGPDSRVIMTMMGNSGTPETGREIFIELHPSGADSTSTNGATRTWTRIPGSVPQTAADGLFTGFYKSGESFGAVSLSFTTG